MFRKSSLCRREVWEFEPTPEHKSLVLLLYRNILKGLVEFKSFRRRSLIAYARIVFRKRKVATEKLLIDECIEEARRAAYVIQKNHDFTKSGEYEYDSMGLPKDTNQDVKTYMEDIYDPEMSKQQFARFQDVIPGQEHLHKQNLGPSAGEHHWKGGNRGKRSEEEEASEDANPLTMSSANYKVTISEEDKVFRPPPPPMERMNPKGWKK